MNRTTHSARSIRLFRDQSFAGNALRRPDEEPPLAARTRPRHPNSTRPAQFNSREVVERVRSRLGESHCSWALRDECYSKQVEWLRALQRAVWTSIAGRCEKCSQRGCS